MRDLLLVGMGGFVGSVARYAFGAWVTQLVPAGRFPLATLAVNTLGCLAIGVFSSIAEQSSAFSLHTRLVVITGVLGGFTTFSAFAYESYFLAREQAWAFVALNIAAHVLLGLAMVWLGHAAASQLIGRGTP
ncbi:MAG: fluoride efflux transporter CrcB [Gemmatimonadota bacterium]|nr:fluoride efflux transporter CrcB [Gemmatimonadota bacterium]